MLELGQVLHAREVREQAGIPGENPLQLCELAAKPRTLGGVFECPLQRCAMPEGGERSNLLVEDDDGNLGELAGVAAAGLAQDLSRQFEELVYRIQRGGFVTVIGRECLGRDPGEQLDVHGPGGVPVAILGFELRFQKARLYLQPGQAPTIEQLDRKSTRLNSSHPRLSRMPSSA